MSFCLMRSKPEYPLEHFSKLPELGQPWVFGAHIEKPSQPLVYRIHENIESPLYPLYELPHPLIRRDLLEKLTDFGIDNLQCFPATLYHPQFKEAQDDYVAFNVVGIVATCDMATTIMRNYEFFEFESDEIDGIESDFSRIPKFLTMARLADRVGRIIVSHELREHIDMEPGSGLAFFDLT